MAQAYLGDRTQSLQLFRRYVGEDGKKTVELKELRSRRTGIERAVDGTLDDIRTKRSDVQELYSTVDTLKTNRKVERRKRKVAKIVLFSAKTALENWSYDHSEQSATLPPCENYDRDAVKRCANESNRAKTPVELKLIGCALDQIQCLHDTRVCAIERAFI